MEFRKEGIFWGKMGMVWKGWLWLGRWWGVKGCRELEYWDGRIGILGIVKY